ncbi:IS630 family transposase [Streptomyces sp. AC1-42W]|uniref:IS630 family transposase n=1 Tax=Streptomyces sp. AC1-42W TaxID=2218666 RepID=UPI00237B9198|nr:IS630 family transposase [Streptomyces sp. AC1-42W]
MPHPAPPNAAPPDTAPSNRTSPPPPRSPTRSASRSSPKNDDHASRGRSRDPCNSPRRKRRHRHSKTWRRPSNRATLHDYVRHGTTNLFAALNIATGEVLGECKPNRNGANFLAFLKKVVKPHAGKEIHIVLDNLSTHTTPDVMAWLEKNPHVHFHFTPVGSSWLNQIEIWFGIITRQSIRRGTFSSVHVLVKQIRDYINSWNQNPKPFTWTATTGEILAKVRLVATQRRSLSS